MLINVVSWKTRLAKKIKAFEMRVRSWFKKAAVMQQTQTSEALDL